MVNKSNTKKLTPTLLEEIRNKFVQGIEANTGGRKLFTIDQLATDYGIPKPTLYKHAKKDDWTIKQKQFQLLWRKGATNMADYFTKHHPPWHHKQKRYKYLHQALTTILVRIKKENRERHLHHHPVGVQGCVTPRMPTACPS